MKLNYMKPTGKKRTNDLVELQRVINIVCDETRIHINSTRNKCRRREFAVPRMMIMYFAYTYSDCTFRFIGEILGGRDHSTVLHGVRVINNLMTSDPKFRAKVKTIEGKIYKDESDPGNEQFNHTWEGLEDLKNF